jgi:type I restriction enzyme S subunit
MSSTRCPNTSRGWFFKDIPAEWDSIPLKYACVLTSEYGANIPADRYVSEGIRFLRTSDINDNGELASGGVFISEADAAEYLLAERDLLISRSGTVGRSFLYSTTHGPCAHAGYLIRYRLKQSFDPKYIFYLTKSAGFQKWIGTVAIEATIGNVNGEKYANFSFPSPSFQTQFLIANYLDRETARIDRLIAEKERMLALLDEKRSALISRVVTRGLNPDAPLKVSGQDWLGIIPEHWDVPQLRFVCKEIQIGPFGTQLHAEEYVDNGVPLINPAHLKGNKITPDYGISVDEITAERLAIHRLEEGDIVFGRRGQLGRCAVVQPDQTGWLCGTGSLRARCNKTLVDPTYVALVFNGSSAATRLTLESVGSTMDNLNTEMLGHFCIPLPPLAEQKEIVRAVEAVQCKTNALRDSLQLSIALAKERRAALINVAITRQILPEEKK